MRQSVRVRGGGCVPAGATCTVARYGHADAIAHASLATFHGVLLDKAAESARLTHGHPTGYLATGLIAGHFLGLRQGPRAIPARWLSGLELRDVVERVALDLCLVPGCYRDDDSEASRAIRARYPGW